MIQRLSRLLINFNGAAKAAVKELGTSLIMGRPLVELHTGQFNQYLSQGMWVTHVTHTPRGLQNGKGSCSLPAFLNMHLLSRHRKKHGSKGNKKEYIFDPR